MYSLYSSKIIFAFYLFFCQCYSQKIRICVKKLGLVDDTLEKLGTPKEYRTVQNSIIWALIIYLVVILISFTVDSIWNVEKHNTIKAIVIPLVMGYPFHVNTLGDIMFAFILRFVKSI